jgi:hypothetical protein
MKIGIVFFHKNLDKIYKKEWVDQCIESIKNQTIKNISYYEIDYGDSNTNISGAENFYSEQKANYADAMNYIISKAFEDGCNYVFNTNMDDYYHPQRIEKQIYYLEKGFDIVSSDFKYIDSEGNFKWNMIHSIYNQQIKKELDDNHNVIAHPAVGYGKDFWKSNKYDIEKTPEEDLDLWKRSINSGFKFFIVPEILLTYRIHDTQVSKK